MLSPQIKGLNIDPFFVGKVVAVFSLGLLGTIAYQRTCACGPDASGRSVTGFLSRSQKTYYQDHQTFAQSLEQLQIQPQYFDSKYIISPQGLDLENFIVTLQGTTDKTTIKATPKIATVPRDTFKLGLRKSYFMSIVGTVSVEDGKFHEIMCISEEPT